MQDQSTLSQQIAATVEGRKLLDQEDSILELQELICSLMRKRNNSASLLAKKLGKPRYRVPL
jgi:hypothetical protein